MYTSTELQMLRNADPGVVIPGIDTATGNVISPTSLKSLSSLPTSGPIAYDAKNNIVRISGAGVTLSGYDLGTAGVLITANNVTVQNCTFTNTTGYYAVVQANGAAGMTVTNCTFSGNPNSSLQAVIASSTGSVTVTNNSFLNSAGDGLHCFGGGLISGNYFSQAGNNGGAGHPDAIWLTNSSAPMTVTNNFIDWTLNPAVSAGASLPNDCVRITGELGPTSNVTVTGNFLFGGASSIQAIQVAGQGALSNVSITNNYMGFASYYGIYPGSAAGITETGNVTYDWTNSVYSSTAWTAYVAAGVPTASLLTLSSGSSINAASAPGSVTLYGAGQKSALLLGGAHETNYVGGFGSQTLWASYGANIFTYLSPSDSLSPDTIVNFDPVKDVIDLSHMDASVAPGVWRNFTFIGTAAFYGSGAEVRYQQNANGSTSVQVAMAGDPTPDMQINMTGLVDLTAANFALTAAQSRKDMANGAALSGTPICSWPMGEDVYANVQGHAYSSYASIWSGSYLVADDLNLSASSGEIDLLGPSGVAYTAMTITKGGGRESAASDGGVAALTFHQTETIQAGHAQAPETFAFSAGWGNETINGFATSGANADTIQLSAADFSYLTSGMTQNQELAAVLLNATGGANGTTIADSHGDRLTLAGISVATLAANPGLVKFV